MKIDCRQTAERLASYADDLLTPDERAAVDGHLAACPPCLTAAGRERGARAVLREKADVLRQPPLPPGLRSRCEALAREHLRPEPPRHWATRLVPVSLTAMLVIFTALAIVSLATKRSDTLLAAQLTADHSKCFRLFGGERSATADAARLEQMLSDRYGWDVHVPPSSPADGVQLVGARRCLYADGRLPHVMYRVNGRNVSLYMLEGIQRRDAEVTSLGHHSHIWSRGATTYVLVAPSDAGDLTNVVRYVKDEAR